MTVHPSRSTDPGPVGNRLLQVDVLPAHRVTSELAAVWSGLQCGDPVLHNPFFSPGFMRAVAEVRDDVEVVVLLDGGVPVGFLPFQRQRYGVGVPVAGPISDIQGAVAQSRVVWDAGPVLRAAGVSRWHYDCLSADQDPFRAYHVRTGKSPFVDLRQGFAAYERERRGSGSSWLAQVSRKARKMEREVGPLRFVAHTTRDDAFGALLAWKAEQYRATGTLNVFRWRWVVNLLERLRQQADGGCAGVLSALYAGDALVSVHLGIRSRDVLAWWYPAYDPAFARYSPGATLLARVLQAGPDLGITRVDLGQGDERYKRRAASGSFPVAEGVVGASPWRRACQATWVYVRDWAPHSSIGRFPLRVFRRLRNRARNG